MRIEYIKWVQRGVKCVSNAKCRSHLRIIYIAKLSVMKSKQKYIDFIVLVFILIYMEYTWNIHGIIYPVINVRNIMCLHCIIYFILTNIKYTILL